MRAMIVFGTRPETTKMLHVVDACKESRLEPSIVLVATQKCQIVRLACRGENP